MSKQFAQDVPVAESRQYCGGSPSAVIPANLQKAMSPLFHLKRARYDKQVGSVRWRTVQDAQGSLENGDELERTTRPI